MFGELLWRAIQRLPYKIMRIVIDESEHNRMKHRLSDERRSWGQGKQDTWGQDKEEHSSKECHHWMKHDYTYHIEKKKEGI